MAGTPLWCRSKCSPLGVMMPSSASSGVRDAPAPVVPGWERTRVRVTSRSYVAGEPRDQRRFIERAGAGQGADLLGILEVRPREADHVSGEHLVAFRGDVDVAHAEPPRPGVDQVPERDRNECFALYRRHRSRAALDQEPCRPVPETPAVMDVEAPRRGATKLVADVLGHDAARDLARFQISGNALLEQARELQLRQAYVPVRIALHVSQRVGVQSLDQPFGKKGHAVLLTPGAPLDDRALQDVGDPIEGNHALGELLTDDGQRRAGGAADAEGQ